MKYSREFQSLSFCDNGISCFEDTILDMPYFAQKKLKIL